MTLAIPHLKPNVDSECNNEDNCSGSTDGQDFVLELILVSLDQVAPPQRGIKGAWDHEAKARDEQKPAANFAHSLVELLFMSIQASDEEAESKTQKQVGKYGPQDGGFYDRDFTGSCGGTPWDIAGCFQENSEEYDFDDTAKECLQHDTWLD